MARGADGSVPPGRDALVSRRVWVRRWCRKRCASRCGPAGRVRGGAFSVREVPGVPAAGSQGRLRPAEAAGARWCFVWLLGLCLVPMLPASSALGAVEGIVRVGGEADDNPERRAGTPGDQTGAVRLFGEVSWRERLHPRWDAAADGRLGGRFNFGAPDASGGAGEGGLRLRVTATSWLDWSLRGSVRERVERLGDRNYRLASALTGPGFRLGGQYVVLEGGAERFRFHPQPEASSTGTVAMLRSPLRLGGGWSLPLHASLRHRRSGEVAVLAPQVPSDGVAVSGDDGAGSEGRTDTLWGVGAGLEWELPRAVLELRWSHGRNDSSAFARSYRRHAAEGSATVMPVGDLLVRGAVTLQRTRWPDSRFEDVSAFLEDENRNQFSLTLEHPLAGPVFAETRVTHFRQAFGGEAVEDYRRTLVYAGLAWWF